MVEMELNKIRIDENRGEQVIVLKEKNGKRLLPIIIGMQEATAIKMEISHFAPPRPLTHDLINNIINSLGARLERMVIEKLEQNIFYAKLIINIDHAKQIEIDARPSDSIAVALRAKAPIYVAEEVLNKVAIPED
jgi:bifunctional DNase/RNase